MESIHWRNDQIFQTSIHLGISNHIMYLLSTGRNAWHGTWNQRYNCSTSLHFTKDDTKKCGSCSTPRRGLNHRTGSSPWISLQVRIAYCAEFHSQESFKMHCWDDPMDYLKICTSLPVIMDIFSTSDSSAWESPRPDQDSFVTRVFDLAGNIESFMGQTNQVKAEPLDSDSKLTR